MQPAIIVLSFNSEDTLGATLSKAREISNEIFVVDSFSKDGTVVLAESFGAKVVQHPFEHYGAQRNWAIDNLAITSHWQLHLDADEVMDDKLVDVIRKLPEDTTINGYFIARYVRFLGRVMRHGAMSPTWHLRLFRSGIGRCEERRYDQHFLLKGGDTAQLSGEMIDDIRMPLTEWTARHNRWADGEVAEMYAAEDGNRVEADKQGNPAQRKRYWRKRYNQLPLFVRPFALFFYRYFFRLGFLDGKEGFIFWTLQTFWFRFLVDAKIFEKRKASAQ
ncbi:glycosyltransferase family 2 protein [Terracidiphilus gabretensis]|uniref:glycosyltransferase family 2 protein n=1 Tax=Terracidiphilus gabretensis TaxID=1577687 RepID=UPI00071B7AEA|nr:glycosyltransferase family 2 protein [Terracidiphilus gabretensis]